MYNDDGTHTAAYDAYIRNQAKKDYESWKNFDINEYRRQNGLPGYANGGRVTKPTLAVVGEKEPETIVPDSKKAEFGTTTNYITINVEGYNIQNDEEFTELLSRKLSELSVRQQRAVGGAGW
jgi:SLT domain-containing protein